MSSWSPNIYLRRLHRISLYAVLGSLVAIPAIYLICRWMEDTAIWILGGVGMVAVAGYAAWLAPALLDPRKHASYRELAAYGDPDRVAQALAVEMVRGGSTALGVVLGREWIVIPSFTRLDGVRRTDVMWIYPRVTTTRYYGVIPAGSRHEAVIVTRRREFTVIGTKKTVDELLRAVHHAAPWAPVGYTDELRDLFSGDGRALAFQQVDAWREEMPAAG